MTTKPAAQPQPAGVSHRLTYLPDPPKSPDAMQQAPYISLNHMVLADHFLSQPDVLVGVNGYLCYDARDIRRAPVPDLLVAFGVAVPPAEIVDANGYTISEIGKPPDFVLEVASSSTGWRDYTVKRDIYAGYGVQEYWRFDHTGGRYHDTALAGDRLVDGAYEPIPVTTGTDGIIRGYSAVLDLELHSYYGELRLWDPKMGDYLPDLTETKAQRDANAVQSAANAAQRDEAYAQRDVNAAQRDDAYAQRDVNAAQRDDAYAQRDSAITQRDEAVAERDAMAAVHDADLARIRQLEAELRRRELEG